MRTPLARVLLSAHLRPAPILIVIVAAALAPAHASAQAPTPSERVPARLIARAQAAGRVRVIVQYLMPFQPESELADTRAVAVQRGQIAALRGAVLTSLAANYVGRVRSFATVPYLAADTDVGALRALEASPLVASVREDALHRPALFDSTPLVGATDAWNAGYSGQEWTIAVLDSGVDSTHAFLGSKVISEACYSTTSSANNSASLCPGGASASVSAGSGLPCSASISGCDHGTHVAGIAAGTSGSFSGVARDATIIAIQVFSRFDSSSDCGSTPAPCVLAYTSDIMMGLERVYALGGSFKIAAANLSLGGAIFSAPCDAEPLKPAIDQLRAVGIATVVSSGNDGSSGGMTTPACISSAVSVASTTKWDEISSFGNTASFLSLLAPGSSIWSSVPGGGFTYKSGTSMAAPHVAGAWAVLKQRKANASVSEILAALRQTGQSLLDTRPAGGLSFPRVRVKAALDALSTRPRLMVDLPAHVGTLAQPFAISGWALDQAASSGTGIDAIHVWAHPNPGSGASPVFVGAAAYGGSRPDVGAIFGSQFVSSGYGLIVRGLAPGSYQFVVYGHSSVAGAFNIAQTVTVTVAAPLSRPRMAIDTPAAGATVYPSFVLAGWALDAGAASGTGVDAVHVWAYPNPGSGAPAVFLGAATYGGVRSDVGAAFGTQFTSSAYRLTVAGLALGTYQLVVYARSTVTGSFNNAMTLTVHVAADPQMWVDLPMAGTAVNQPFAVAGWALDRAASGGSGVDAVHVWALPAGGGAAIFLGAAAYGASRPDVGAVFGSPFTGSGFGLTVSTLSPGSYQLIVYAHSTVSGTFNNAVQLHIVVN